MDITFTPVDWVKSSNIYEINVRQYTDEGTFAAFRKHLPRLREMGIEILWFMPVTPISKVKRLGTLGSYYACSDYTSINPEFGTPDDFKTLVHEAHQLGFKVIIDWVANHTGWDHTWTVTNPDFYKKDDAGNFYDPNGWEDVIDLDYTKLSLRSAMIDAMQFWIDECNIDGFRCDMAHLVPLDFWKEARQKLDGVKKLFWLAETEEPSYHKVFDATYGWELLHKMEALYNGLTDIKGLEEVLEKYKNVFPNDAMRLFFTSNHDENSHSGSEYERLGNAAKIFAVLCATWQNSLPLIYSGQELPNTKRLRFFDKDIIEWKDKIELHDFYKALLTLRKNHEVFKREEHVIMKKLQTSTEELVFAYSQTYQYRQVVVLLNLSPHDKVKFEVLNNGITGKFKSLFSGLESDFTANKSFELQAWEFLVFEK